MGPRIRGGGGGGGGGEKKAGEEGWLRAETQNSAFTRAWYSLGMEQQHLREGPGCQESQDEVTGQRIAP